MLQAKRVDIISWNDPRTISSAVNPTAASTSDGFSVQGGKIYDANGAEFIPQGVNHAHAACFQPARPVWRCRGHADTDRPDR